MTNQIVNQGQWGICGFVAVLNALHQTGTIKEFGKGLTLEDINKRLGAELVTFLKIIKEENPDIGTEIVKFTQSFGSPYNSYKSIDQLVEKIKQDLINSSILTETIINTPGFGIAMTADAVKLYLEKFANLSIEAKKQLDIGKLSQYKNCVIGLGNDNKLKHWVYIDKEGYLYNWGNKQKDLTELKNYNFIDSVFEIKGVKV
ncbi:MAG: hypothetical protein RMY62_001920 [Nostoc sp. ZfuVER08]|jgi:hypothetical protein|nr:hypothetical protein [Nostoc sp. GBBB01]MDZ8012079.1 hypothetical protein [Nostoc sp. ZfuVER08]